MDINTALTLFLEHGRYFRDYAPATLRKYRQAVLYYTKYAKISTLDQVSERSVRQMFLDGRMNKNWSPWGFITYRNCLVVFFDWCKKEKLISENPAKDIIAPKHHKTLPKRLTKQDAEKLLETAYNYPYKDAYLRDRNHAIFATLLFAGLRQKEILQLRYADVDLQNMTLFIQQAKGNKDRIIPICQALAISLGRYVLHRKRRNYTCTSFFTSNVSNRGLSFVMLLIAVKLIRKTSGVSFSLHKLRHTFATLMIEGGADIYSLAKMMGHEDIKTTTIYLGATTRYLKEQMYKHPLNTNDYS